MIIGKLVEEQAKEYGDKVFLYWIEEDLTVTYSQLNILTNKVANLLYDLGIIYNHSNHRSTF